MIVSELGSTYPDDEGGVYDWVKRAFGRKVAGFVAWCYWVNFPLWIASLALVFPSTIGLLIGSELGVIPSLVIELAFIWIVVIVSFSKTSDSAWLVNVGAILKVGIAIVLGILGFMYMVCLASSRQNPPGPGGSRHRQRAHRPRVPASSAPRHRLLYHSLYHHFA